VYRYLLLKWILIPLPAKGIGEMYVVESYPIAVALCLVTMFCWGSWANTQKAVSKEWRFQLFYWDYVLGVLLVCLAFAFTLGSTGGASGRGFLADLAQADPKNLGSAFLGGVIFNASNILLVAAIDLSGMAVAFPVGVGLGLVLGVIINYMAVPEGDPIKLFIGVALIVVAIVLDAIAYGKLPSDKQSGARKGLFLAIGAGILISFFYRFVAAAMPTPEQFADMPAGKVSPYTAVLFLAIGMQVSNFLFNPIVMWRPFSGLPVPFLDYFKGSMKDHLWGLGGGIVWGIGTTLSMVAAGKASFAISYGLGQGATMVAALWGVFIWREFRTAPPGTARLLVLMFLGYIAGLALLILAK
jgi:glucose uptake protein